MTYNQKIPPFKWFILENFPYIEEDFDALTNWQLFCKLGKEMNKIIEKCNLTGEQVERLTTAFNELKQYVDDYFENLDIQEEVNTKLDEMAESGELADIIAQYIQLQGVLAYDSVADMAAAENLVNGSFAKTYGFHSYNDKGGSYYKIRTITNEDTVDGISIVAITNTENLVAELIEQPIMYVEQYGAYGDGTHDDYNAIQYAIEKHLYGSINFSESTYLISQPIKTYIDNIKQTNIIMQERTTIKTNNNLDCLIELGGLGGDNNGVVNRKRIVKGGVLDATNCTSGIKVNSNTMGITIENIEIKEFTTYGIYVPVGSTLYSSDLSIKDCYINGKGSQFENYGIYFERPDNNLENLRINAVRIGLYLGHGGQFIHNVHGLGIFYNGSESEYFPLSKFIVIPSTNNSDSNFITDCYCDTFGTFVESDSNGCFVVDNSTYYSYISNVDVKLFVLKNQYCKYIITNNTFRLPTPVTKNQGIIYTNFSDQISLRPQYSTIKNNNIDDNSFNSFVNGDLLLQTDKTYCPFWLGGNTYLSQTDWVKIGYTISGLPWQQMKLNAEGYNFVGNFKLERYGTNTYVSAVTSEKWNQGVTVELGFKYENNTNGYNVYGVYLRQPSGTALKTDITIEQLNKLIPFIPFKTNIVDPTFVSETMDSTYSI